MGLRWLATVLLGIAYLFFISWKLTLVMLSVVPIVAISARMYGKRVRTLSKGTQEALAKATETADESFSQIRTVRSFSREPLQVQLYSEKIALTYELGKRLALLYGLFVGVLTFIASAAMVLVL
jgi:ABC-type multidrug transport system fused ATPase/permease subunit